eukprot:CAMPEP_0115834290 /NCGR_PEP_ID=MMETSP0287-20121206/3608_1 /TAXON_ID=412157 /ORGANISM="Chrysochromulina rotalis, Strain UIO044" /LENGTH=91 /DNA_ID=CAMNT_0003287723 /DNA_START=787 /DNA_END=1058 /DNA_ORIENTATION=+
MGHVMQASSGAAGHQHTTVACTFACSKRRPMSSCPTDRHCRNTLCAARFTCDAWMCVSKKPSLKYRKYPPWPSQRGQKRGGGLPTLNFALT